LIPATQHTKRARRDRKAKKRIAAEPQAQSQKFDCAKKRNHEHDKRRCNSAEGGAMRP
jgi:hypothetical protein